MLGLLSVWVGVIALAVSVAMIVYRPAFNDVAIAMVLYITCPLSLTLGGLVLWTTHQNKKDFEPVRLQAKVAVGLALAAAGIVYLLVQFAQRIPAS